MITADHVYLAAAGLLLLVGVYRCVRETRRHWWRLRGKNFRI